MTNDAFEVEEIVSWYRVKQRALAESDVRLTGIEARTDTSPAADFDGIGTMGRINGWVSGEFDFEVVKLSDGTDQFWKHVKVSSLDDLETVFSEFTESMQNR